MKARTIICLLVFSVLFTFTTTDVMAEGAARGGFVKKNSAGGVTAGYVKGIKGQNGGAVSTKGVATDGQGNAVGGSAGAFKTPAGTTGARGGAFKRSADGSVQRKGKATVSGEKGTATTEGSFSKDASGNVSGTRSTEAQSNSGSTYEGSTTYSNETGVTHTGTCTDASGSVVACPRK